MRFLTSLKNKNLYKNPRTFLLFNTFDLILTKKLLIFNVGGGDNILKGSLFKAFSVSL